MYSMYGCVCGSLLVPRFVYPPALSEALDECLVQRCILGDGLHDGAVSCHVSDCPLAHVRAAQTEDVADTRDTPITSDTPKPL